jgi:hypothetical protein
MRHAVRTLANAPPEQAPAASDRPPVALSPATGPGPGVRISVGWNDLTRAQWDAAHAAAGGAYQQDWAYGAAMAAGNPHLRLARAALRRADGSLLGLAQVLSRPVAMVARLALCTLGPVWTGAPAADERRAALKALRSALPERWPRLLVITPDEAAEPAAWRGFSRVMTGDATVRVDLTGREEHLRTALDGKWRNALGKAEKSPLKVQRAGSKPAQYRWLLEAEARQREARGYRALPSALTEAWQASKAEASGDRAAGLAVFRADHGQEACAGMLFLIHGSRATYHLGWSNETGRSHAAHNLLLWTAMLDLKARGLKTLDLGGVNTQSGAGIARFKLGAGGEVLQRAGSFV